MIKSTVFRYILIFLLNCVFEKANSVIYNSSLEAVILPQGKIRGSYDLLKNQRTFLGIPYATVPGRFQEPGKPPSWNGTFNAINGNVKCNQYFSLFNKPVGQEDCLVLNIYTPISMKEKLFPVMVFVHGGGFYWGSNSDLIYNPKYLVKENVIVVTINYRLGAFGFLCLGLKGAPGNVGIKDQLAALKWIHSNIAYFGGDSKSVTLFGESSGGASVNYFLLSNAAQGLFHRAIIQSGSILMPQAFSYRPIENTSKVAIRLGYNTSDPNELLNIFKNSSADDIVKASHADETNNVYAPYIFTPCKEDTNENPFITTSPKEFLNNNGLNIPVIVGFNDREGIYWARHYYSLTLENLKTKFDNIIPSYLLFEKDCDKVAFMDDVFKVYFKNTTVIKGLIEFFSDSLIAFPSTVTTETFLEKSNRTVYNYYFRYDSLRNINKFRTRLSTTQGACHGDELFYLFDPVVYSALPNIPQDNAMIKNMAKLWTSFAKTGTPSTDKTAWHASSNPLRYLEINTDMKMITPPNNDRMQFWRKTFEKYGR